VLSICVSFFGNLSTSPPRKQYKSPVREYIFTLLSFMTALRMALSEQLTNPSAVSFITNLSGRLVKFMIIDAFVPK